MPRTPAAAVLVGIVIAVLPGRLQAQSLFVSGTVFANIHRAGGYRTDSPYRQDDDLSATTIGGGVGVGTAIGRHVVIQVELMAPEPIEQSYGPPEYLPPLRPPTPATFRDVEYRTRHGSILGGYRTAVKRRVSAALLGGVMFMEERTRTVSTTIPTQPFQPLPSDSTIRYYRLLPAFGLDVSVDVFSHLAIVPQLRVHKVTGSGFGAVGLWPGLSVRWTF